MRTCTINIGEKDYELSITRNSIKWLENRNINIQNLDTKIITSIDELWMTAFVANYPNMTESDTLKLLEQYSSEDGDVMEIVEFVAEEYKNFVDALIGTSKKKKAKISKA